MDQQTPTHDVVLLIEQELSAHDAEQIRGLHREVDKPVRYHVLIPVEDAAARVESAMGSLAASEVMASPALVWNDASVEEVQRDLQQACESDMAVSLKRLRACGADSSGEVVSVDPIDGLAAKVQQVDAAEAIVLTRPHVVAEFFRLDWTSRARRKIGVPCLHLLERETAEEPAGDGPGAGGG